MSILKEHIKNLGARNYFGIIENKKRYRRQDATASSSASPSPGDESAESSASASNGSASNASPSPTSTKPASGGSKGINYNADKIKITMKSFIMRTNGTQCAIGSGEATTEELGKRTRLNVDVSCGEHKLKISFLFSITSHYWSLINIEIKIGKDPEFNTTLNGSLVAAKAFSYICPGVLIFRSLAKNTKLIVEGLHLQPDMEDNKFGKAYDCSTYTTVPILTGIFLIFLLLIVFGIGINGMASIKITTRNIQVLPPIYPGSINA